MSRYRNTKRFVGLLGALVLLTGSIGAQTIGKLPPSKDDSGRPSRGPLARLEILEIRKDDAKAAKDAKTGGRLVPVNIRWKVTLAKDVKLTSLTARLVTTNTDHTQTRVEKLLPIDGVSGMIDLPMPQGVFAKAFQLEIIAGVSIFDGRVTSTERATKSGNFPVPRQGNGANPK